VNTESKHDKVGKEKTHTPTRKSNDIPEHNSKSPVGIKKSRNYFKNLGKFNSDLQIFTRNSIYLLSNLFNSRKIFSETDHKEINSKNLKKIQKSPSTRHTLKINFF